MTWIANAAKRLGAHNMKALIISDIHSNIYSLKAIWEKEKDCDVIFCAGDLVDYGPFPKEVIQWCRERNVTAVKGNHDEDVINHFYSGIKLKDIPEEERTWVHYNASQLDESDIAYLKALPYHAAFTMDGIHYCMKHSYIHRSYETIESRIQFLDFWNEYANNPESEQKRVIFGHTHYQAVHYLGDQELWLNPGSTSYRPSRQSIDLSQDAHYMTITGGQIQFKRVSYDLSPLYDAVKDLKMKESQLNVAYRFFKPR